MSVIKGTQNSYHKETNLSKAHTLALVCSTNPKSTFYKIDSSNFSKSTGRFSKTLGSQSLIQLPQVIERPQFVQRVGGVG